MGKPKVEAQGLSKFYKLGLPRQKTIRASFEQFCNQVFGRRRATGPQLPTIWALKKVSFSVDQGETVGIIGKNGSGKSTLLKLLSRITAPSSGSAIIRGRVASLLEVGTGFHPELTGRENIYLNGIFIGMRRREVDKKFDEIVAFSELEKFIDTPIKRYSTGMFSRLAFSVAAHLEPEILLMDEILAVGDIHFQNKCLKKTELFVRTGRTVLVVSHDLDSIRQVCHRCIWLERGQIVQIGRTSDVLSAYVSKEKAGSFLTIPKAFALPMSATSPMVH